MKIKLVLCIIACMCAGIVKAATGTFVVRDPAGKTYTVDVDEHTTVAGIKEQINKKYGRPLEGMKLISTGITLTDGEKIAPQIQDSFSLYLVYKRPA